MVERVLRNEVGKRITDLQQKVAVFKQACREAISPMYWHGGLEFDLRRDISEKDYDVETLRGFIIIVATQRSKRMPPKEELARLKAFLETDAEPQWCEVL